MKKLLVILILLFTKLFVLAQGKVFQRVANLPERLLQLEAFYGKVGNPQPIKK